MNFCSLRDYAVGELSRQAAQYELQVTIKQGCRLEAHGLNLDDRGWLELRSLKNINWHAFAGGTPFLFSIASPTLCCLPWTSMCPAQPCRKNTALLALLPSHHPLSMLSHRCHIGPSALHVSKSHGCSLGISKYLNLIFNLHCSARPLWHSLVYIFQLKAPYLSLVGNTVNGSTKNVMS